MVIRMERVVWLGYVVPSVLLLTLWPTGTLAADEYFEKAIQTITKTLESCPESYGFDMEESYTNLGEQGRKATKRDYSFWTSKGKMYGRTHHFDPGEVQTPYMKESIVVPGTGGEPKGVMAGRLGKYEYVNIKDPGFSIGTEDTYFGNAEQPRKRPIQIMANPCFAPLPFTTSLLQTLPVKTIVDKDGNKGYELEAAENQYMKVLRLYFSPKHHDALVKSVYEVIKPDTTILHRTVRVVEKWQELPDGTPVPAQFKLELEMNGKPVTRIVRIISNPEVGIIDDARFDISQLPEFKGRAKEVWDVANATRLPNAPTFSPNFSRWVRIVIIVLPGLVGATWGIVRILQWWKRRHAAPPNLHPPTPDGAG